MKPEDEFIVGLIPLIRKYLTDRQINSLDKEFEELQKKLNQLIDNKTNKNDDSDEDESLEDQEDVSKDSIRDSNEDGFPFELLIWDLKEDVQEYIANTLGYDNLEDLISDREDLDSEPICSFIL